MKVHEKEEDIVVACCDENLLGEELKDGEFSLNVKKEFYGDEACSRGELVGAMENASIINLIGSDCVRIGIEEGFIDENNVLYIGDVPHAQMVYYLGPK